MASKPRPSLLDLFDPLLADAVRVPIPESPPTTPQKTRERGQENKENLAPNDLTMSVFFNRISRNTYSPTVEVTSLPSGLLVDLEDAEVWLGDDRTHVSPRVPLTELSVDDFALPSNFSLNYGSPNQKSMSQSCSSFSRMMPLPPSPLHQTQLASSLPAVSENDTCHSEGFIMQTTRSPVDSVSPQVIEPRRESLQTSSSTGLLHPDNHSNPEKQSRRRSSVDISTTLASLSSNSLHMPDGSFDLVNGEISFLAKSSEGIDVDHDVHSDSWGPQTPLANLPPQTPILEESPLDLSRTTKLPSGDILSTTSTSASIEHADISFESQLGASQPPLPSLTRTIRSEHPPLALDTVKTGGQDTPPGARRASSVPAPIKKHRVFTSKQYRTANTFVKQGAAGTVASSSLTSKVSPQESAFGCGTSCNSGIPRGSATKGAVTNDIVEQPKRKSASSVRTNLKVSSRMFQSIDASSLHKEEIAERSSRMCTTSRLPGPAGVRGGTVANQGRYGGSESTQQGRSIPVRSRLRLASSKDAGRTTER